MERSTANPRWTSLLCALLVAAGALTVVAPQASAGPPANVVFLDQPQDTGRGLPFVPVIRVLVTDAGGAPVANQEVTLSVTGTPAGVRLANGPGQSVGRAVPTATTGPAGIASFPGTAVQVDSTTFTGGSFWVTATAGTVNRQSEPFFVGRTSPPWLQQGFGPQRTGWSPNTADFSTTRTVMARLTAAAPTPSPGSANTLGDVATTPLLVDLTGDGILDVVLANSVPFGRNGAGKVTVHAWDVNNGGTLTPASLWTADQDTNAIEAGGTASPQLAAFHPAGSAAPFVVVANVEAGNPARQYTGTLGVLDASGAVVDSWGAPGGTNPLAARLLPVPVLVAKTGASGAPMVVLEGATNDFASTVVQGLTTSAGGTLGAAFSNTHGTGTPMGGALASAELRGANAAPEIVVSSAYESTGWDSSILAVCVPSAASLDCTDQALVGNSAINGIALGDLDGDGRPEIVANGLRSYVDSVVVTGGMSQVNVFQGTTAPLSSGAPLVLTGEGDQMNVPALGALSLPSNLGPLHIVNVNNGAPPIPDPSQGDAYTDTGDVRVRGLQAGPPALVDEGSWTRGGSAAAPAESPGGGILLDLDHDYRPDYAFGSRTGDLVAARVIGSSTATPPAPLWSLNGLGSLSAADRTQGVPAAPLVAGDVTDDCRAELFVGLTGGQSGRAEVAVVRGQDAIFPGVPSFTSPVDYTSAAAWGPPNNPPFSAGHYDASPGGDYPVPANQARLAWNAPASDGGLPIFEYRVWRDTSPAFASPTYVGSWPSGIPPTAAHPFIDGASNPLVVNPVPAATSTSTYYYKVAAVTCFTMERDPAPTTMPGPSRMSGGFESEVRLPADPAATLGAMPFGDPAYLPTTDTAGVRLSWATVGGNAAKPTGCQQAWGYNVYRRTLPGGAYVQLGATPTVPAAAAGASVSYLDTTAAKGSQYAYRVRSVNCVGESSGSADAALVDVRVPSAPTAATVTSGGGAVTLSWSAPADVNGCGWVEGYRVFKGTSPGTATYLTTVFPSGAPAAPPVPWRWTPGPDPAPPAAAFPATVTFTDPAVSPGVLYRYQVSAVNCVGEGLRTSELAAALGPPLAVTLNGVAAPALAASVGQAVALTPAVSGGLGASTCAWTVTPAAGATLSGAASCTATRTLTASAPGTYTVRLAATDQAPQTREAVATVTVTVPAGALVAVLTPPSATGPPASPFLLTPSLFGGTAPRTCSWSVSPPAGGTLTAPAAGPGACASPATFTSSVPGTYTVTLSAADGATPPLTATATATLTVVPPLSVSLAPASALGNPGTLLQFQAAVAGGNGPVSCAWSIAPAGEGAFMPPPGGSCSGTATFIGGAVGGSYTVQVTATDSSAPPLTASAAAVAQVVANLPPSAGIDAADVGQPGQGIGFTGTAFDPDGTVVAWKWDFGDGGTSSSTHPTHAFAAPGTYLVRLVVIDDAGGRGVATHVVTIGSTAAPAREPYAAGGATEAPVADAGPDLSVPEGSPVRLAGAGPEGATFSWVQVGGPPVTLADARTAHPSFTAPRLPADQPALLTFSLTVADGPRRSAADAVTVTVTPLDRAPQAWAGVPFEARSGASVRLDGSASRDPDGDRLTYLWRQAEGPAVRLSNATAAQPTFTAPDAGAATTLRFVLTVSDGRLSSDDSVAIWVRPAPLPDAQPAAAPAHPGAAARPVAQLSAAEPVPWAFLAFLALAFLSTASGVALAVARQRRRRPS